MYCLFIYGVQIVDRMFCRYLTQLYKYGDTMFFRTHIETVNEQSEHRQKRKENRTAEKTERDRTDSTVGNYMRLHVTVHDDVTRHFLLVFPISLLSFYLQLIT